MYGPLRHTCCSLVLAKIFYSMRSSSFAKYLRYRSWVAKIKQIFPDLSPCTGIILNAFDDTVQNTSSYDTELFCDFMR